ncbi:trihelix transcription factor PTL-like [Diospyros lotus]|uniref:trihelix transcription factor PTL-like n=1 Tax=Diospyros lotus TaxID=55363 RepID=UPI0022595806|nr:trihelix transcription factor PTL-like [Diospyros lotus]
MEDQYGLADLRQYMNGRPHFPAGDLFGHRNLTPPHQHHYDMVMVPPRGLHPHHEFGSDTAAAAAATNTAASVTGTPNTGSLNNGLEVEAGGGFGGDGGSGRWPRQETLTLLEIRSRLDSKFKEANHKGPLWDEVSRIMSEEHGYQRSGKKCREKFENLYKYYKKTKEGKAGRQDGKHYRFFRQLEALYGDSGQPVSVSETHHISNSNFTFQTARNNINAQANQEFFQAAKLSDSISLSNSSEFGFSSSDESDTNDQAMLIDTDSVERGKKKRRGRRTWKAKIREFIDSQMGKLMEKQEEWLEKMMKTIESKEQERILREEEWRKQEAARVEREHAFWANERSWIEARDAALMEALKKLTGKEVNENGGDEIKNCIRKKNKKCKENSSYFPSNESMYNQGGVYCDEATNGGASPPTSNAGNMTMNESCFKFLVGSDHGENLWENYALKLSKGEN